jgi:uncharacterized protein (DUF3084 family)
MISQLNTVEQFSALIDLMKNPEKFDGLVKDAKRAVQEMKDLLGAKATVEAADAYSKKADADITKQYNQLEAEQKALEQDKANFVASSQAKELALAQRSTDLDDREQKIKQREIDAKTFEKNLNDRANDVTSRESTCVAREAELRNKAAELEEKAARIAAILK